MGEMKHTSIEVNDLRNDLWVRTYGTPVQCEKQGSERGKYQHPELYGMPNEMGINYHPEMNAVRVSRRELRNGDRRSHKEMTQR